MPCDPIRFQVATNCSGTLAMNMISRPRLQGLVVTSNVGLRDKLHIAKAATRLSRKLDDEQIAHYHGVIKKIATATSDRNMMAHALFWPAEKGDGVEFNVVKARDIDIPSVTWSIANFRTEVGKVALWGNELEGLASMIGPVERVNALMEFFARPGATEEVSRLMGGDSATESE